MGGRCARPSRQEHVVVAVSRASATCCAESSRLATSVLWGARQQTLAPSALLILRGTPPRAGTFKLTLTFTEDYPNKAPTVRFESKMFHPNSAPSDADCCLVSAWAPDN